ncbi:ATP-grasp domain-containing protein [Candidatus Gracilibacteria bacterium]|nr:ATP-grasp domain-containing protein [Candidatus Gracilibacteria bacterium]
MTKSRKLAIICGGPSLERGISLNSARSLYDNLNHQHWEVSVLYVNPKLEFFKISPLHIYSNTPLDFDYRLADGKSKIAKTQLKKVLSSFDMVFPAIHGAFGEDGKLQKILEEAGVAYVGSDPAACKATADKFLCQKVLGEAGFYAPRSWKIRRGEKIPKLPQGAYVAKPLHGGSSIGVQYIKKTAELPAALKEVFSHEPEAIIEPLMKGTEFTVIVLENAQGQPVALMPTEIELQTNAFFDYRKKYLPTAETRYHTPGRFSPSVTERVRREAARAFKALGMRDFGRLDGWLLPDGNLWFSDVNAISGMDQNSFLFQQAAVLGLSHAQLLEFILSKKVSSHHRADTHKTQIPVLFGGPTAERQVSTMSGTNVVMKLRSSRKYHPLPIVMNREQKLYHIPYFLCLQHTVEEIEQKITELQDRKKLEQLLRTAVAVRAQLGISHDIPDEPIFIPEQLSLAQLAKKHSFIFLGLHGGAGEDGTIQKRLDGLGVGYNGSGPAASRLCMDKFETGRVITEAAILGVTTAKKYLMKMNESAIEVWKKLRKEKFSSSLILKPRADGCSAGVIRVSTPEQFKKAIHFFNTNAAYIPAGALHAGHGRIELPVTKIDELLIEDFIATDSVRLKNHNVIWKKVTNWIELTVGVLGKGKDMQVMLPSQTIAEQETLSLEEKFMGGTGINLVPPPPQFVKPAIITKARERLKKAALALGISGYARIDCFLNRTNGDLIIIEANTLPALTPSTTFFQQAACMKPPLSPRELLERLIMITS